MLEQTKNLNEGQESVVDSQQDGQDTMQEETTSNVVEVGQSNESTSQEDSFPENGDKEFQGEKDSEIADPEKSSHSQSKEENAIAAAARRKAEQEIVSIRQEQNLFAQKYGYENWEQMKEAQKQQEYVDQGNTPEMAQLKAEIDQIKQESEMTKREAEISKQKAMLKNEPFFNELENEIAEMISNSSQVDVDTAYRYILGKEYKNLVTKEKKAAEKRTIANMQDRARRGVLSGGEPSTDASLGVLSDFGKEAALRLGVDLKEVAKHVSQRKKEMRR